MEDKDYLKKEKNSQLHFSGRPGHFFRCGYNILVETSD